MNAMCFVAFDKIAIKKTEKGMEMTMWQLHKNNGIGSPGGDPGTNNIWITWDGLECRFLSSTLKYSESGSGVEFEIYVLKKYFRWRL